MNDSTHPTIYAQTAASTADAGRPRRGVLILGANGRIGTAAALAFHAAGWRVAAQVRRPMSSAMPAGVEALTVPLADTAKLARAAGATQVVVHAVNPLYTRWDAEALPLLDQGLDVARRLGARFMLPGNVYNFGADMPALLREDTIQRPTTTKGRQRVAMESAIETTCAEAGIAGSVIRAGDFFGAGSGSWFDLAIVRRIAAGKLVYPGPRDVPHAWAYLPDLARAFVAVAEHGAPGFRSWHFGGYTLTGDELLAAIEAAAVLLGIAPARGFTRSGFPWPVLRVAGLVYPLWRELARMSYLWRTPHGLDGSALAALPGVEQTPLAVALRDALLALGHAPRSAIQSAILAH